mgnify:CR=1 FL=1
MNKNNMIKITIAMAIYHPNLMWFREQLESLNNQTYNNIEIFIYNDCPNDGFEYVKFISKYLNRFPFKYLKGEKNLGSNKAFEFLTNIIESDYIAYCDQDDIWLPEKLEVLVKELEKENADLLCSDMYVIDKNSNVISDSVTKIRPHQKFYMGKNIFEYLSLHNFVTGCTMLVKSSVAKKAIPFSENYYHDWWIALNVAIEGKIKIIDRPLIKYRIHDTNQSEFLKGIYSKNDYYLKWISLFNDRVLELTKLKLNKIQKQYVENLYLYAKCRVKYFNNSDIKNMFNLLKFRNINKKTTYFEIILPFLPEWLFKFIIMQIRKGKI